jgi:transcriptional regulator with XRE-family HTH domain
MQKDINKRVGLRIREVREEGNISQEKLAELAGVHRTYIGQIERGEKSMTLNSLERISRALKVNIKELF